MKYLIMAALMLPIMLFAEGKGFCSSIDAYNSHGRQNFSGAGKPSVSPLVYTWKIKNLSPGPLNISMEYLCSHEGGSDIEIRMADQTLQTVTGNTGLYTQGRNKGKTRRLIQEIGTITIDKAGAQTLVMTVYEGAGTPFFEFNGLILEGRPMVGALVQGYKHPVTKRTTVNIADQGVPHNTLTDEEKKAKWKLLFNGKNLSGWFRFHKAGMNNKWAVDEGTLHLAESGGGYIMTVQEFKNFELSIDWKISSKGNSGILLRATEASYKNPWEQAIEIQVLDHWIGGGYGNPKTTAGAVYDLYPLKHPPANSIGEWNTTRIIVNGYHYQVYLNDVKTADFTVGSDDWYEALYDSKFWRYPGFGLNTSGSICLQDHGDKVWYRNIKIKAL